MTTFEDISHHPNILLEHADDGVVSPLGVLFLLAGLTFIGAGIGVLRRAPWWPPAVAAALSLSLVVTILWSKDAIAGLVINIAVLIVLGLIALGSHLQQQNRGLRQAKPV
ncbi:MAG TPA: hypothetical protein VGR29_00995 [Thermomicrobiales bacterium]|nr:hypothetical protein [Thermomicrobiales bacterium]